MIQSVASTSGRKRDSTRPIATDAARPTSKAEDDQLQTLTEDQPEHVARLGAERDADPDLPRPQRGAERHDAVDADEGKRQARAAPMPVACSAPIRKIRYPKMPGERLIHRPQVGNRQIRREILDLTLETRRERRRVSDRADVQRAQRHVAYQRKIDVGARRFEDQHVFAVARDADDLEQRVGGVEGAEATADRILSRPVSCRHRLR